MRIPDDVSQNLLSVPSNNQFVFDLGRLEGASYKYDVVRVVFAEQYPAALWHIVKV